MMSAQEKEQAKVEVLKMRRKEVDKELEDLRAASRGLAIPPPEAIQPNPRSHHKFGGELTLKTEDPDKTGISSYTCDLCSVDSSGG